MGTIKMKIAELNKRILHELEKRDRFFDGRFRVRKINSKRKERGRRACRGYKIKLEDYGE